MNPLVKVRDLHKTYDVLSAEGDPEQIFAVDGVSFDILSGGSLAIVGESGSGKTTISRILAGLEVQTAGSVEFDGEQRNGDRVTSRVRMKRARQVQMVFQDPYSSLDPRQSVRNTLTEVLAVHGVDDREARVAELLEQVGLDDRQADSLPRNLSGGQRQRVAIARSLALEPQLLILDEAVAALDASVQAQVINLLADLRDSTGVTYLFVSHDLGVIRQITDECLVMLSGKVVESGMTEQILTDPEHDYTKRLLSAIPSRGWQPRRRVH